MKKAIVFLCLFSFALISQAQHLPAPTGLMVELLRAPEAAVITNPNPNFGWIFPQSGIQQSAYQIIVASSPFLLSESNADLWNSGKVSGDASVNVRYEGKSLAASTAYWWQVKIWSERGLVSQYSGPQQFNTGDFDRSNVDYPGQSRWVELSEDYWVSEDKQCASFDYSAPVRVSKEGNEKYFVEFEKSAIGILTFTASSAVDNVPVIIHMGERKQAGDVVHKDPGRSNIGYQKVEMTLKKGRQHYIVKIAEREIKGYLHSQKLAPQYPEVMPFRYVEILGDLNNFRIEEIKQGGLYYYFDETASHFSSSSNNLNEVWDLCKYTQKATPFLGVYADGNRERMPYEADAYIQMLSHFATDREYSIARYTINFLLDHASWPTEWQMHTVMMAWEYYMQTGDAQLLKDRYEDLKRKSLIALTDDNDLISTRTGKKTPEFLASMNFPGREQQFRDIVDWPQGPPKGEGNPGSHRSPLEGGETDGYVYTDYNTVVNAFHYRCLVLMTKIADAVGNEQDRDFFRQKAKDHREAFLKTFFDERKGVFVDGESTDHSSLHANMFPLAFGLVPEEHVGSVAGFIKSRGMACSVYGSQYLLEALYAAGEADHALTLMTSEGVRSWMNMIRVGSSMTTEAWDQYFKPNLTWNHAWGSAPANIAARKLMGVEPLEATFKRFRINPQPGRLNQAEIVVPCVRGAIEVSLRNNMESWIMRISVPGNSTAELWLPERFSKVKLDEKEIPAERLEQSATGGRNVYVLGSGVYQVVASK